METIDVVVIGGGPAGLAAAREASRAGARTLVLERDTLAGGILRQCVHNGFGLHYFGEELTGPQYGRRMVRAALEAGAEIATGAMVLEITKDRVVRAVQQGVGVREIRAGAVVLATGCRERTRGALKIPGTRPAGVYTAGTAQRLINIEGRMPGKRAVILGSGDIGLIMARRMTWEGAKVLGVMEVLPYPGGLARNVQQCLVDYDIPLYLRHTVAQIHGRERVEGVTVAQVDERYQPIPGTEFDVECDTLLLSVGLIPENELARSLGMAMDPVTGGAVVDENRATSVEGVFACGNALIVHDLADNASVEGEIAGRAAAAYASGKAAAGAVAAAVPGKGVRFVVPQRVTGSQDEVTFQMRVRAPMGASRLEVLCGGNVIAKANRPAMAPGEMESITVQGLENLADNIEIRAVER
nr:FAD-dependent oxidoreductase [bacterium]